MRNYPGSQLPARTTWQKLSRRWATPCISRTKTCPSSGRGIETNFLHSWLSLRPMQTLAWAGMSIQRRPTSSEWGFWGGLGGARWRPNLIHLSALGWPRARSSQNLDYQGNSCSIPMLTISNPFIGPKREGTEEEMWDAENQLLWDSRKMTGCLPPSVEDREGWSPSLFRVQQRGPQGSDSHLIPFVFT